jgi:hypothetical protein
MRKFCVVAARAALCCGPVCAEHVTFGSLWSGGWEADKHLTNRLRVTVEEARFGLRARAQVLDKRPSPPWQDWSEHTTNIGAELGHVGTGSKMIWGPVAEAGLAARLRGLGGSLWAENHKDSGAELKTAPVKSAESLYLYGGSPSFPLGNGTGRAFTSVMFAELADGQMKPSVTTGMWALLPNGMDIRAEGFYHEEKLEARKSSAWFSNPPPIPARETRLWAGSLALSARYLSIAGDYAWSATEFYGKDVYGNLGLKVGKKPFLASAFVEGVGERYVGSNGKESPGGARFGFRGEWYGKRSALLRAQAVLKTPRWGEAPNGLESGLSYRFATAPKAAFQFTRVSFTYNRDRDVSFRDISRRERVKKPPHNKYSLQTTIKISPQTQYLPAWINASIKVDLTNSPEFDTFKLGGDAGAPVSIVQLKWGGWYMWKAQKENQWETWASAQIQVVNTKTLTGRVTVKAAWTPEDWKLSLTWRMEQRGKG